MAAASQSEIHPESGDGDDLSEELDPRVQEELEKLNVYTEEINQLELQLEDANCLFRTLLTDSTHQLKSMAKKLGSCIEKARPYYDALVAYQKAQNDLQSAATHYQRASGIHLAAKETIALAEERFLSNSNKWDFDNAWQEMLNHATIKVMEAEKQKSESEQEHLEKAATFQKCEAEVQGLEKKLGKFVHKSQPYFEQKDAFNKALAAQKAHVEDLQVKVHQKKAAYSQSLRNLEEISESIHERRRLKLPREPGVGAEKLENCHPSASHLSGCLEMTMPPKRPDLVSLPSYDLDECDGASCLTESSGSIGPSCSRSELKSMQSFDLDEIDGASCSSSGAKAVEDGDQDQVGVVSNSASEHSLSGLLMRKLRLSWRTPSQEDAGHNAQDNDAEDLVAFGPDQVLCQESHIEEDKTVDDVASSYKIDL